MNRYDTSKMTRAEMRERIDTAERNRLTLAHRSDADDQMRRVIVKAGMVWAVWPDDGPGSLLGHGLAMLKGAHNLMAHLQAGRSATLMTTSLWFPSFEAAEAMCKRYGDDGFFDEDLAS